MKTELIPGFIYKQFEHGIDEGVLTCITLSVDISGFTHLTETLMATSAEGVESVSVILNTVFSPLVRIIYSFSGFIPYFSGDGFQALFPYDRGGESACSEQVIACCQLLRASMQEHSVHRSPLGEFSIDFKIGVSQGEVQWGILGGEVKTFYFRGAGIEGCIAAQSRAVRGEILIEEHFVEILPEAVEGIVKTQNPGYYRLQQRALPQQMTEPVSAKVAFFSEEILTRFVHTYLVEHSVPSEFRNVVSVFLAFDDRIRRKELHELTDLVLENITTYSGYLKELDFGDKGGVFICFFGVPKSFENNTERALDCLLSIKKSLSEDPHLSSVCIKAGVTYGRAFTGFIGGASRQQYAVVGKTVNLAARLMENAEWHDIQVDSSIAPSPSYVFTSRGPAPFKGIDQNVERYILIRKEPGEKNLFSVPLIGRKGELEGLREFMSPLFDGRFSGIALIYGDAGVGKSHLLFEIKREFTCSDEIQWCVLQTDQIHRKSFHPFLYFLRTFFHVLPGGSQEENRGHFSARFQDLIDRMRRSSGHALQRIPGITGDDIEEIITELQRTRSVLGALLGIYWAGSLWEELDSKGKHENSLNALKNFFVALTIVGPVVIELEDGHWLDPDSREVFTLLTRSVKGFPIVIISSFRYNDDGTKATLGLNDLPTLVIDLEPLEAFEINTMSEYVAGAPLSDALQHMILEKGGGNPFYSQQILRYCMDSSTIILHEGLWQLTSDSVAIPNTITEILIARLDRLSYTVSETVKAASILGREFEITVLSEMLKTDPHRSIFGDSSSIKRSVSEAESIQIWSTLSEFFYIFNHSLLRDAAFEMQLKSRRRHLHKLAAEAIERLYREHLGEKYEELAWHFEQAELFEKAVTYYKDAAFLAGERYQNQQALDNYDRLIHLLTTKIDNTTLLVDAHLHTAEILQLCNRYQDSEPVLLAARALAERINDTSRLGKVFNIFGHFFAFGNDYQTSLEYYQKALSLYEPIDDKINIARALKGMGIIHFSKGEFEQAKDYFEQALSQMARSDSTIGLASIYGALGVVHNVIKDYRKAKEYLDKDLALRLKENDLLGISITRGNLGIFHYHNNEYQQALEQYTAALALSEKIGNKSGTCIHLNNMGLVYRRLGMTQQALTCLHKAHKLALEADDKAGIVRNRINQGDIYKDRGEFDQALACFDEVEHVARQIEYRDALGILLHSKGEILLMTNRISQAQVKMDECKQIARSIGSNELQFSCSILEARIMNAGGQREQALQFLEQLLPVAENDENRAILRFYQWTISKREHYRREALELFNRLTMKTATTEFDSYLESLNRDS